MRTALANRSRAAVFLCYHSIAARGPRYLTVAPDLFEAQLRLLRRLRYRSGRIEDLARLARGERLPGRTVFLTFDDGFRDNAEVALPLMRRHGFAPIVFLLPGHVDEGAALDWPEVAADHAAYPDTMRSVTWAEVEAMAAHGAQFGSHTMSHSRLAELGDGELQRELAESRRRIEKRLGSCDVLAYPFGEWDARVARAAAAAGYEFAFSLPQGPQEGGDRHSIPRVNVDLRDRGPRFLLKLSGPGRGFLLSDAAERARGLRRRGG